MSNKYVGQEALIRIIAQIKAGFSVLVHNHTVSEITDFPKIPSKTSELVNDSGYKTTDNNTTYTLTKDGNMIVLTGTDGSSTSVEDNDTKITVDTGLSSTSTNPVQNKVVKSELDSLREYTEESINNLSDGFSSVIMEMYGDDIPVDDNDSVLTIRDIANEEATIALNSSKEYTNTKTANLASTTVVDNKVSSHNTSIDAHNDIRDLINRLTTRLNTLANSTDEDLDQLAEIVTYIKANKSLIDSITTSKINVSDIVDNLTTSSTSKVLSAKQGVTIKTLIDALQEELDTHGHTIDDVSGLQTALDAKANFSHGTHVTYSTTAPVMDGTTSVGSASTVARSDHRHPTDTSRASQASLDALESVVTGKSDSGHTHTVSHTPVGTVSKPNFTGSAVTSGAASGTTTVYSITAVGSLPSLSTSVTNRCLTLTFGAGSLPTKGSGVSVATGAHTHSVTASGSVSQPTFTGTAVTLTSSVDN